MKALIVLSNLSFVLLVNTVTSADEDVGFASKLENALETVNTRTKDFITTQNNPIRDGVAGLLALSLLGGAAALYSPKKFEYQSVDRSGHFNPQPLTYAQRVAHFENHMMDRITGSLSRIGKNARKATGRLRHGLRRAGQRSLGAVRASADTVARMAKTTDHKLRGMARVASRGLRRMSSRLGYAGHNSIERIGSNTGNVGVAAIRGMVKVGRAYMRGVTRAKNRLVNGLRRVGSTYRRGISRVGEAAVNVASAYSRGVARMGSAATSSLSDVASDGISRLGEVASQGAATIGGFATNVADVATAVPKGISSVAKDKKIRDCLLQTFCYVSTPFIDPNSNYVKRSAEEVRQELGDLTQEEQAMLQMEDCEVFQCEVVSLGRKAYNLVASGLGE